MVKKTDYACPNRHCMRRGGILFFVRFWLDREIRQCDRCGGRWSIDPGALG